MDVAVTHWINSWSGLSSVLDTCVIALTQAGVPLLVLFVALQWWSRQDRDHVRHACVACGLTFLLGLGANQIIIAFFQRLRPYELGVTHLIIDRSTDASFPSDHATATFAIAFCLLAAGLNRRALFALAAAILISLSRVYVGTHYVSDLLGGAAMAAIATVVVRFLYRKDTKLDRAVTSIL
ncbi:phosphatase PAP2 family protein [Rhizobium sp. P38BS-XIX]|uniref:phosphatase PAP2 family protein n=1 Tax=Rhizobium sp. P38BS-XIX TaxID=2726740 RepID=UPI001456454F|nr:phosphatase PAP2 family protein [Rhizobium sp. P38BS-XIX]NLS01579.1 phosphatase PAP2 family protein [Rhizobium sp. P38BS-XIX]